MSENFRNRCLERDPAELPGRWRWRVETVSASGGIAWRQRRIALSDFICRNGSAARTSRSRVETEAIGKLAGAFGAVEA